MIQELKTSQQRKGPTEWGVRVWTTCVRTRHNANYCRQGQPGRGGGGRGFGQGYGQPMVPKTWYYCGEQGHIVQNCPHKANPVQISQVNSTTSQQPASATEAQVNSTQHQSMTQQDQEYVEATEETPFFVDAITHYMLEDEEPITEGLDSWDLETNHYKRKRVMSLDDEDDNEELELEPGVSEQVYMM